MNTVVKNILYNGAYQLLLLFLPLVTIPYVSRILGSENIGIYAYYVTFATYFLKCSKPGVGGYGSRSIAAISNDREAVSHLFSEIYGVQFCASCIAISLYAFLMLFSDNQPIYLAAGLFVLSGILDISWLFFGLEDFKRTAIRSMVIKILSVAMIFIFVRDASDLVPYTIICCGTHAVTNLVLWLMLPSIKVKLHIKDFRNSLRHLKPMLILFLPFIGISCYNYMDKLMLGSMVEIRELGFYQSAESIMTIPTALIAAFATVMLPRMSKLYSDGSTKDANKYIMISLWAAAIIVSAFAFGIFSVAPNFVPLFYGPGFEPCILLLRILMFATIFLALANVVRSQILLPRKYDKVFVISIFAGAGINLILNFILIPNYGAVGASIATVAAEAAVFLVQTIYCAKFVALYRYIIQSMPFILLGLAMSALLCMLPDFGSHILSIIIKTIVGGVFYITLSGIYYFKVLRKILKRDTPASG